MTVLSRPLRTTRNGTTSRRRLTPLARREALWGYLFISPWIIGFLWFRPQGIAPERTNVLAPPARTLNAHADHGVDDVS